MKEIWFLRDLQLFGVIPNRNNLSPSLIQCKVKLLYCSSDGRKMTFQAHNYLDQAQAEFKKAICL